MGNIMFIALSIELNKDFKNKQRAIEFNNNNNNNLDISYKPGLSNKKYKSMKIKQYTKFI